MGFSRFWLTMADKEIKVHRRVIRMIFPMIQRAINDRSVRRALPVYDNAKFGRIFDFDYCGDVRVVLRYAVYIPSQTYNTTRK